MPSLSELQRDFSAALISGEDEWMQTHVIGARDLDAAAALAVYRNNVFSNYCKALRDDYPAILALVGERFFDATADAYTRAHPSRSGDLNEFGAAFASFLEQWPPAQQLPYLPDVARLEWAIHLAFNAGDARALDFAGLAKVPAEMVSKLRFDLHPSAALVWSAYPLFKIWQISTTGSDERVDLDCGADRLLVMRRAGTVEIESLTPGEWAALDALARGSDLSESHARALEAQPAFDLGGFLQRHALAQTIVFFHQPHTLQEGQA